MWKLMVTPRGGEWAQDGLFPTITAAVRRIQEIEQRTTDGLFLNVHFCTLTDNDEASDAECLGHMHFNGRDNLYGIKRVAH